MSSENLFASLAIHTVVLGAMAMFGSLWRIPEKENSPVPIYFEVLDVDSLEETEAEQNGTGPPAIGGPQAIADEPPAFADDPPAVVDEPLEVVDEPPVIAEESPFAIDESPPVADESSPSCERLSSKEAEQAEEQREDCNERAKIVADPIALNRIVPAYPRSARRKRHEGSVTIEVGIAEDGGISSAKVIASSGHSELDEAAFVAVRQARFAPATEDGVGVCGLIRLTFDFRLR